MSGNVQTLAQQFELKVLCAAERGNQLPQLATSLAYLGLSGDFAIQAYDKFPGSVMASFSCVSSEACAKLVHDAVTSIGGEGWQFSEDAWSCEAIWSGGDKADNLLCGFIRWALVQAFSQTG